MGLTLANFRGSHEEAHPLYCRVFIRLPAFRHILSQENLIRDDTRYFFQPAKCQTAVPWGGLGALARARISLVQATVLSSEDPITTCWGQANDKNHEDYEITCFEAER